MAKTEINIGDVFSRLTVLEHDGARGRNSYLKCRCSCGVVKSVRRDLLVSGDQKSCGCLLRELNGTRVAVNKARREAVNKARREACHARQKLIEELNKTYLKEKKMAKCEHGKTKSICKDCGGGSICEHDRVRSACSGCEPDQVFRMYAYKANERGLTFRLTLDEFKKLIQQPCHYCGEYGEPRGLDRVDNRLPYLVLNCVPCCSDCNFMKRTMDRHRFVNHAIKIARHADLQKRLAVPLQVAA